MIIGFRAAAGQEESEGPSRSNLVRIVFYVQQNSMHMHHGAILIHEIYYSCQTELHIPLLQPRGIIFGSSNPRPLAVSIKNDHAVGWGVLARIRNCPALLEILPKKKVRGFRGP